LPFAGTAKRKDFLTTGDMGKNQVKDCDERLMGELIWPQRGAEIAKKMI
jgi:hypothetical protein